MCARVCVWGLHAGCWPSDGWLFWGLRGAHVFWLWMVSPSCGRMRATCPFDLRPSSCQSPAPQAWAGRRRSRWSAACGRQWRGTLPTRGSRTCGCERACLPPRPLVPAGRAAAPGLQLCSASGRWPPACNGLTCAVRAVRLAGTLSAGHGTIHSRRRASRWSACDCTDPGRDSAHCHRCPLSRCEIV